MTQAILVMIVTCVSAAITGAFLYYIGYLAGKKYGEVLKGIMRCPYCLRELVESTRRVYETLSDHVCDPNGTPPERASYICQCSPGIFYGEHGDVYVVSRETVESWFRGIYFKGLKWRFGWLLSSKERYLLRNDRVDLVDLPAALNSTQERVDKDMRWRKSVVGKIYTFLYRYLTAPYWHFRRKKFGL